ncbi:MAG: M23 family metallopeptidase [Cyclobacteriaceae bacterium]|nr:M23 family metallopeptidase [Cyclobacteriaceae bacterium]MCH8517235.1 M23 family metallopeptidase [Cyclobacteriaceae bacterium]
MARIKYYYDTDSCKYERVKVTKWDIFLNSLGFLTLAFAMSIVILLVYSNYFDSPKEAMLKKENEELNLYYDILEKELRSMTEMISVLQDRDENIYRVIFEADAIPASIRNAGVGGVDRYKGLLDKRLEREDLIVKNFQKIDKLKKQMYIQTKSYDDILDMAQEKEKMLASIPAIQPIHNKELTRLASGFGMRMHPIHKIRKMHTGVDFSAPRGTPIYATGDGTVVRIRTDFGGYGKHIEIDHGFGFRTLYAHMQEFDVKIGQSVKRGEMIGKVGNTGSSTAPHLHYEIIKDGRKVNPVHYFFQDLNEEEYDIILKLASEENQSLS